MSRLLQHRLRKTDVIGRYGGEEFAVILVDTEGPNAVKALDGIRESFAQIQYLSSDTTFSATFSCGIVSYPHFADATQLSEVANNALYKAKNAGRNRAILAN